MISWCTKFPQINQSTIEAFEASIGVGIPEDFRKFLLMNNGGEPVKAEFSIEGWGETLVHVFYGLDTGYKAYDIDWSRSNFEDVLPKEVIPIACDPGGYLICLGLEGNARGKLYFWDRGGDREELMLLASSFDDFLDRLDT